jgi:hypothetical protein
MKKHLFILFVSATVTVAKSQPGAKPLSAILVDPTSPDLSTRKHTMAASKSNTAMGIPKFWARMGSARILMSRTKVTSAGRTILTSETAMPP